ncbi:hypothetical protein CYMTET_33094 [Cymbomonas tetramitiformis]|uniref:Trimethylguanosine synthase n=1 Tax=Cymbomonas tetramitiformis TaxID=36881 RepID=A0AAE0FED6_9CHLO|nr:hypothetical protein CYMTET_33094 [Cymbomonas tetramitiformis]
MADCMGCAMEWPRERHRMADCMECAMEWPRERHRMADCMGCAMEWPRERHRMADCMGCAMEWPRERHRMADCMGCAMEWPRERHRMADCMGCAMEWPRELLLRLKRWGSVFLQKVVTAEQVSQHIDFVHGDFATTAPSLHADVLFLSPPWGGPNYLDSDSFDVVRMQPFGVPELLAIGQRIAPSIAIFLPRNSDLVQVAEAADGCPCEIERNYLHGKLKAITVYFGDIVKLPDSTSILEAVNNKSDCAGPESCGEELENCHIRFMAE